MEPMLAGFAEALSGLSWNEPVIPVVSNVTGKPAEPGQLTNPAYWVEHVRRPVRFAEGISASGGSVFLELGPGGALSGAIGESAGDDAVSVPALRDERGEAQTLLLAVAELFVRGAQVDWAAVLPEGATEAHVDLPTYAFDHQHYWLRMSESVVDAAALGLAGAGHPLLGAVVPLPQSDGLVLTSRLSLRTHPWLADHAVGERSSSPGAGLVELAVRAGDEVGCGVLDELVVEAPLVVPEQGAVRVQITVGGPDGTGTRSVEVYAAPDDTTAADGPGHLDPARHRDPRPGHRRRGDRRIRLHRLAAARRPAGQDGRPVRRAGRPRPRLRPPLPGSARAVAARRRAVRRGRARGGGPGRGRPVRRTPGAARRRPHPAVREAVAGDGAQVWQPLEWNRVVLHATGATVLRARLVRSTAGALSVEAADETGGPVLTADAVTLRPVSSDRLTTTEPAPGTARRAVPGGVDGAARAPAHPGGTGWIALSDPSEVTALAAGTEPPAVAVLDCGADGMHRGGRHRGAHADQQGTGRRPGLAGRTGSSKQRCLVVRTRGAVPAGGDTDVTDPAAAAVWGLVRVARAENPDRIVPARHGHRRPRGAAGRGPGHR